LYDEIQDADGNIPTRNAIHHFIFTLGSEFEPIQNNYRTDNLPSKWHTDDWPTILILCRNYYNSVKPQGVQVLPPKNNNFTHHNVDRLSHQKKVKEWFLSPVQFCQEITSEQKKYPNKCIYHLSDSHCTDDCHIKKECAKQGNEHKSLTTTPASSRSQTGQLCHITEDMFVDAASDDTQNVSDSSGNDTNEDALLYFARVSNHYLHLVKNSSNVVPEHCHSMSFPVIVDSGANYHMFKDREFFDFISPASGTVLLGDGTTTLPIKGVGTVTCKIGDYVLQIPQVRYIPDLSESIYSLFVHIQTPNHGVQSSYDKGLFLQFPEFTTQAVIGRDDIYLDVHPIRSKPIMTTGHPPTIYNITCCRILSEFHANID